MTNDRIPTIGTHRGVSLFDRQGESRLSIVRADIDAVLDGDLGLEQLAAFAGDGRRAPEARLLAGNVVFSFFGDKRFDRQAVGFDLDHLAATIAGLDSAEWRCPRRHTSLIDGDWDNALLRDQPLDAGARG